VSAPWILVVDDDEDVRDTLLVLLEMRGYGAAGAADGIDALEQIRTRGRPDLILLDLRMPRMNGEEFAAALHADPALAPAPIVVFSGDTNAVEVTRAMGARSLLKKPFDVNQLFDAVRRAIPAPPS
jgi:CheY-like chemotaxis protein